MLAKYYWRYQTARRYQFFHFSKKKQKVSEVQKDKFIKERDLARRIFLLAALLVSLTALRYHNI